MPSNESNTDEQTLPQVTFKQALNLQDTCLQESSEAPRHFADLAKHILLTGLIYILIWKTIQSQII